ncbi:MAG: glycosyltransferase [Elusimicrobia bacterium]|nr:glycosyltransferase [Elusimicrobiota bacterium]
MERILLVNFAECPENLHFEQAFIRALRRRGGAKLDILHDFDFPYTFIKKLPVPGGRRIKYSGARTFEGELRKDYSRLVILDFPKRKRCALPFIKLVRELKAGKKFFLANHLIPMPGQNFTADAARRFKLFAGFNGASILESDDTVLWRPLGFDELKLFKRNYAVDCAYYRPEKVQPGNYVFSAGSAGRDFSALAGAAKKTGLPVKIFSDAKIALPGKFKGICEVFLLAKNLHNLKEALLGSKLVVLPIENGYINEAAGNSIIFIAMACGVPVLARRTRYMARYIKEGANGFMYNTLSARNLEAGIKKIIALTPAGLFRLRRKARKTVLEKASLDRFCSSFLGKFI